MQPLTPKDRPHLTAAKVIEFLKAEWGATDVVVLGNPDDAIWVYYRGVHATRAAARSGGNEAGKKVYQSLTSFMMAHGDYDERFRDGQDLLQLEWQDHRCAARWPFQASPRPYRTGEICHVGDTIYSHEGSQYTVYVDQGDGRCRLDLREIPGFSQIEKRFHGRGVLACLSDSDRARFDAQTKQAAQLLYRQYEDEYWDAVADFLVDWHERIAAKARMADVLLAAGFTDEQIRDASLGEQAVPVEPVDP